MAGTTYVMGSSVDETQRLMTQAVLLQPITERLLRDAGIAPGMRVLEVGCGAGDVCLLAAKLVGNTGTVLGIDRNPDVLAVATARARDAGLDNVSTLRTTVEDFVDPDGFDCVIGRYVLVHQADPIAFLRAVARLTRPEGVVAFHEMNALQGAQSLPRVELWQQVADWVVSAMRWAAPNSDIGGRMVELFASAGLPQPHLSSETPVGGGTGSPLFACQAETFRSLLPHLIRMGALTEDTAAVDTLRDRLEAAVVRTRSQIQWPPQYCAWARL